MGRPCTIAPRRGGNPVSDSSVQRSRSPSPPSSPNVPGSRLSPIFGRGTWPPAAEDLLATWWLFTAMAVGNARRWVKGPVDEVIVAGGGVRNRTVMADLAAIFEPAPVRPVEELGWKSQAFEATAFAVLAYQTIHGECANVPAVTGAAHPVLLA